MGNVDNSNIQAEGNSIAISGLSVGGSVGGDIRIGHTIGFTSDQVSALITQISTTFQVKPFDGRCPYKGLEVFGEEDAELFFGRETWVKDLMGRVKESRTLFVTGQSGSGKSSLVRAGLIPTLKKSAYGEGWLYATLKPGRDPIDALGTAFSRLKDPGLGKYLRENAGQATVLHECAESVLSERADQRLVLFLDQFEEVFTQLSKDKTQVFINLLSHAATVENGRVIILFSMRSDFVPNCATFPQLNALLNQQFVQIGAMQPEELVSAIAQPALRVGLKIDPDLIAQIINDMKGEPGALPLMQFALKDLFDAEQAKGGMIALTLSDYLEHGGINQALERHANASLEQLTDAEKELARNVFSGLIEIGRGTQDTRRTALSNELIPAGAQADAVKSVVQKLASARLITTDATTVTISHEKLIDAWPWLKKLVNENRDVIALQNEIAADAKEWEEHKRDASYLYSGARLATAREKMTAQKLMLSGLAKDFIEKGIALREAERKEKEALRRRIITGLTTGIVVALVLAGFAAYQMFEAREQAEIARNRATISQANQLGSQSQILLDSGKSIQSFRLRHIAQNALLDIPNSQLSISILNNLSGYSSSAMSPDGRILATILNDQILIWDIYSFGTDPIILSKYEGETLGKINVLAFSPTDGILVSGGNSLILWDVQSGQPINRIGPRGKSQVTALVYSPDGNILVSVFVVGPSNTPASGAWSNTIEVVLLDVSDPHAPAIYNTSTILALSVTSLALDPAGKFLAMGYQDGGISFMSFSNTGRMGPLASLNAPVSDLAFSPDSKNLVATANGEIAIYNEENNYTNQPKILPLEESSQSAFTDILFNPDGSQFAVGNRDGSLWIWELNKLDEPPQIIRTVDEFSKIEWLH